VSVLLVASIVLSACGEVEVVGEPEEEEE